MPYQTPMYNLNQVNKDFKMKDCKGKDLAEGQEVIFRAKVKEIDGVNLITVNSIMDGRVSFNIPGKYVEITKDAPVVEKVVDKVGTLIQESKEPIIPLSPEVRIPHEVEPEVGMKVEELSELDKMKAKLAGNQENKTE